MVVFDVQLFNQYNKALWHFDLEHSSIDFYYACLAQPWSLKFARMSSAENQVEYKVPASDASSCTY